MFAISSNKLIFDKAIKKFKYKGQIYIYYDSNCDIQFNENQIIIGSQYRGYLSEKDGSFVEINFNNGEIIITRDKWGSIPLYYSSELCLISDIINIIKSNHKSNNPDYGAISEFISAGYNVGKRTIYEKIKILMPDEKIKINSIAESVDKTISIVENPPDYLDKIDKKDLPYLIEKVLDYSLDELIKRTSKNSYINLSGGTDSSLLVSKIKEKSPGLGLESLIYFHDDWRKDINDYKYSKIVCDKYGIKQNQININNISYSKSFYDFIHITNNVMHTYAPSFYNINNEVSYLNNESISIINGTGPDESMIGTEKISVQQIEKLDNKVIKNWENYLISHIDYLKMNHKDVSNLFRNNISKEHNLNFFDYRKKIASHVKNFFLVNKFSDYQRVYHFYTILQDHIKNIYSTAQLANSKIYFPYLSNDMYSLIFSVNFHDLNQDGQYKSILKKILINYFPENFVYRKKIGFQAPSNPYFLSSDGMGKLLEKLIKKDSIIFSKQYVDYIMNQRSVS